MWLQRRYANAVTCSVVRRGSEEAVDDLQATTNHREIAAVPVAKADKRDTDTNADTHALYVTRDIGGVGRVVPVGALPVSLSAGDIVSPEKLAAEVVTALSKRLPGMPKVDLQGQIEQTSAWLANAREPGLGFDPQHVPVQTNGLTDQRRADLEVLLEHLKITYPALRVVEFGQRGDPEEDKMLIKLLEIFLDRKNK